ncbi:MAG: gamma-glutamyltransferase, partial [Planctomycetia bacterium]|nr:gamma-glutamyltransferase [Planctomycetia bacterium]
VWEERLTRLGDPSAMLGPPQALLAEAHLDAMLARVLEGLAHPGPGRLVAPDPLRGTSHLAAADASGNVVAWTQTHGGLFGSGMMVPGTGVVLGHGMCRFEPRPGCVNSVGPGKRPLHNMSPVIATRAGRATLAVGASGGRTIVNNSASIAVGRLVLGLDPREALAAPRLQCETAEPAVVEAAAGADCLATLRARGHTLKEANRDAGNAHLIAGVDGGGWVGVAEPRAAGAAVASGS